MDDDIRPQLFLLRKGGVVLVDEDGRRTAVRLRPREMRNLGRRLIHRATAIEGDLPTVVAESFVDE